MALLLLLPPLLTLLPMGALLTQLLSAMWSLLRPPLLPPLLFAPLLSNIFIFVGACCPKPSLPRAVRSRQESHGVGFGGQHKSA